MRRLLLVGFLILTGLLAAVALAQRKEQPVQAQVVSAAATPDLTGFARVEGPRTFHFPEDHGPHPEYLTEWWYYTGNLATTEGRRFGYQLTFFRRGVLAPGQWVERESGWATGQIYMAHFALSDIGDETFRSYERFSRGAAGLSGAQAQPFGVWLEDWSVETTGPDRYRLRAAQEDISLDLELVDVKGPVLQGDQGYSRKGPEPGQASYYYSLTRLESKGMVNIGPGQYTVSGLSWMDREFSTSYLSKDQVGWDWFSVQLDDGSELMLFQLRKADGTADPASSVNWIAPDGEVRFLSRADFALSVQGSWKSPRSGGIYPAGWKISIPTLELELQVEPHMADQELDVSYAYWEGAVRVTGQRAGQPVKGNGYVELTGYAESMKGEL